MNNNELNFAILTFLPLFSSCFWFLKVSRKQEPFFLLQNREWFWKSSYYQKTIKLSTLSCYKRKFFLFFLVLGLPKDYNFVAFLRDSLFRLLKMNADWNARHVNLKSFNFCPQRPKKHINKKFKSLSAKSWTINSQRSFIWTATLRNFVNRFKS